MDRPVTLRDLLDRYVSENLISASDRTVQKHEIAIRHLKKTLGRDPLLDDLTNATVARMMHRLAENGLETSSVNGYRAKIHALWAWACRQGWLAVWPGTRKLKEPKKMPVAWSPKELAILWAALENQPGYVSGIPASLWWRVYHLVAWDSGGRHGERMALRWEHFTDLDAGRGIFPASIRKGKAGDIQFDLHPFTVELVKQIRTFGQPFVTPWAPLDPDYFWLFYTNLLKSAGLPADRAHKSHCLRRSVATHLIAAGAARGDASRALGHSDPAVLDRYIDQRQIPQKKPHDLLFRPWDLPRMGDDGPRAA